MEFSLRSKVQQVLKLRMDPNTLPSVFKICPRLKNRLNRIGAVEGGVPLSVVCVDDDTVDVASLWSPIKRVAVLYVTGINIGTHRYGLQMRGYNKCPGGPNRVRPGGINSGCPEIVGKDTNRLHVALERGIRWVVFGDGMFRLGDMSCGNTNILAALGCAAAKNHNDLVTNRVHYERKRV